MMLPDVFDHHEVALELPPHAALGEALRLEHRLELVIRLRLDPALDLAQLLVRFLVRFFLQLDHDVAFADIFDPPLRLFQNQFPVDQSL